ncbi:MAG: hypothetical protein IJV69_06425 [Kiritimatiellae bacterium]|nr:hypothetical protein [Kiritimatiellia bacterium]
MRKHNRQRKTYHLKLAHLGSAVLVALTILPWAYPAFVELHAEQVGTQIRNLENTKRSLEDSLRRQKADWNLLIQPENLDEAVRQNGISLSYAPPERSIIVRKDGKMEIPAALHASLEQAAIAKTKAVKTRKIASSTPQRTSVRRRR